MSSREMQMVRTTANPTTPTVIQRHRALLLFGTAVTEGGWASMDGDVGGWGGGVGGGGFWESAYFLE